MTRNFMKEYVIRAVIAEEALENWVWTDDPDISKGLVVIKNTVNKKSITALHRTINDNFRKLYNEREHTITLDDSSKIYNLVINEYYRECLDIKTGDKIRLEIKGINWFMGLFKAHWRHPNRTNQFVNRVAIISLCLGIIGFILGIIGVGLGIWSIWLTFHPRK